MAPVFPQVNGDHLGAAQCRQGGGRDGIRLKRSARLSYRCDVVNVNAEFGQTHGVNLGSGIRASSTTVSGDASDIWTEQCGVSVRTVNSSARGTSVSRGCGYGSSLGFRPSTST